MRLQRRSFIAVLLAILAITAMIPLATLQAQTTNKVVVSLVVSNFNADIYSDKLLNDFRTAHPNIDVTLVKYDPSIPGETGGQDAYFTALGNYVNAGDVLTISNRVPITPAATSAGYFLDMMPLANSDTSLNIDDFYPQIWNAYQWDKGLWALPLNADALIMSYDPAAFDKVGIAYPDAKWTVTDIVNAADKLTQKDPSGKVTQAGLAIFPTSSYTTLFRSLLGNGLYDTASVPNGPKIDTPETEALLTAWQQMEANGDVGNGQNDFQNDAMSIGNASNFLRATGNSSSAPTRKAVLLPGGKAGLTVQGYAVSAGTAHPQEAYQLAAFLTTRADLVSGGGAITPARKSLGAVTFGGGFGGRGGRQTNIAPDVAQLFSDAIANGLPPSEMRYADYLTVAVKAMASTTNTVDAKAALQNVQTQALQDQQTALAKKTSNAINVATPIPTPVLAAGKIELQFNLSSFVSPLPNQDKWNQLIADFTATDPQVAAVNLDTSPRFGALDQAVAKYDCFYLPYNAVPSVNLSLITNVDPYLSSDSTFDKTDIVGNIMDQVSRDNKVWAYPIMIQPSILRYNADQFQKANLTAPTTGFTINQFNDDIKALHPDSTDAAPFSANGGGGTHLLILIADYGALPLDYRTNPPKIDFTSQTSVDAIRQVLDLAKNGYIEYTALSALNFGGGGRPSLDSAIYGDILNGFNARVRTGTNGASTYKPSPYPTGKTFSAVSYSIGTAYISAQSQHPEACYRFISAMAKHPELFNAMPARYSYLDNPGLAGAQGADTVALYKSLGTILKDPNTISLPSLQGAGGSPSVFLSQHWLYEAFDNYVLNNGDLESGLKDAQNYATTFQDCANAIPPFDANSQTRQQYNQAFVQCATKADPRLKSSFGG
jgi:ABC-type glycerol-3-phosphate transport system substrate-binding protein